MLAPHVVCASIAVDKFIITAGGRVFSLTAKTHVEQEEGQNECEERGLVRIHLTVTSMRVSEHYMGCTGHRVIQRVWWSQQNEASIDMHMPCTTLTMCAERDARAIYNAQLSG